MALGSLIQPAMVTSGIPATVATVALDLLEGHGIGLPRLAVVAAVALQPPARKMADLEPVLSNLQGRQQGLTQDRQQGLQQQDQLTTDGDRVRRKKAKDQDVEMGKPAEIKAQEGQVIKAIENVLPLKLVVRKDQKGHKPLVNRPGL